MKRAHLFAAVWALVVGFLVAVPASAQKNANLDQGLKPFGSFQGGNIDSVSLTNGNLTLHVPLVSYPQRGGRLTLDFSMVYNNKGWYVGIYTDTYGEEHYQWRWKGSGVQVHRNQRVSGKLTLLKVWTSYETEVTLHLWDAITPDGSSHQLEATSDGMESVDATGIKAAGGFLIDRTGVRYSGVGTTLVVEDPNGNKITNSASGWTDTLGRLIPGEQVSTPTYGNNPLGELLPGIGTTNFTSCPTGTVAARNWNLPGPGGATSVIKLCYASFTLTPSFGLPGITQLTYTDRFITAIVLPNGTKWQFSYNNFGDLTQVTLPTGGTISYTWATGNACTVGANITPVSRRVVARSVNANDGTPARTWSYSWVSPGSVVTDPAGNEAAHTITYIGGGCSPYVTKSEFYEGSRASGIKLKTVETTYSPGNNNPRYIYDDTVASINVIATSTKTTWANGKVVEQTAKYDCDPLQPPGSPGCPHSFSFYDAIDDITVDYPLVYGSVMQTTESDYGSPNPGPILRKTTNEWLWTSNANYKTRNMLDLPSSVTIQDGGGNQFARTEYGYDDPALLVASTITTQHNNPPSGGAIYRGNQTSVSRWLNPPGTLLTSTNKYYDTGTVQEVKDPQNHATTYEYSPTFAGAYVTRITNALGHFSTFNYDFNSGLQTSATDPNGRTTTSVYDNMFRLAQTNAPDGGQVTFAYTSAAPFKVTVTSTITASMNMVSEGEVDGLGRVKQTRVTSDPQGVVLVDTYYDALGRMWKVSNPYRSTSDATYGITETQYDALERITKVIPPDGNAAFNNVSASYSGNATTVTDQTGKQRRSFTDGLGRLIQVDEPGPGASSPATPGTGSVTINGTLQSGTQWQEVCERVWNGGAWELICWWEPTTICDTGGVSITVNGSTRSVNYGQGSTGATIAAALANAFNSDPASPVTAGANGNVVYLASKASGAASNYPLSATSWTNDPQFSSPSFTPVASGPTLTGGAGGSAGWLANPAVTLYTYDALDNLTCVVQKGTDTTPFTTCAAAPAAWRPRQFTYDSLSRLTSGYNPESGTISYAYDNDGNLVSKAAARGITTTFAYDGLHRLTGKTYSNGDPAVSYFYDQTSYNGLAIANGKSRRTGMSDAAGLEAWTYDTMGRVLTDRRTTNNVTKDFTYQYNLDGSVWKITYPANRTIEYHPTGAGRPDWAKDVANGINYATGALYTAAGSLSSLTNGSSLVSTFFYNNRLQPCRVSVKSSGTAPANCDDLTQTGNVLDFRYGFNLGTANNGNVTRIENRRDTNRSQSFAYDALNRIQDFSYGPCANRYTVDIWGNLNKMLELPGAGKPTCDYLDQLANEKNQFIGFSYDAAGNLLAYGSDQYSYDAENRLTSVAGVTYTYDGDGKRVKKSNGKLYWYGMSADALLETNASGGNETEFIFFGGKRVARRDPSSSVFYFFADHLGSSRVVTNSSGGIVEDSDYYPYGREQGIVDTLADQNHKFTGKERDPESTLDYFGARYYSSQYGRFMTPDWAVAPTAVPYADFGNPQSLNLYAYVGNNPMTRFDADGHCCETVFDNNTVIQEYRENPNQVKQDLAIGILKGLVNFSTSTVNVFATLGESTSEPIPQLQPSNEVQAVGMVFGAGIGVLASLGAETPAAASGVQANRSAGLAYQNAQAAETAATDTNVVQNLRVTTTGGTRTEIDIASRTPSGASRLQEAKASQRARLTPNQAKAHLEIAQSGATVVSRNKPSYPAGTQIPPTKVEVVRPPKKP